MLSLLTLNIQAAAPPRAQALLRWLDGRDEDVFILTETSVGDGTAYLLDQCRRAGLDVIHTPDPAGDRGVALISRVPLVSSGSPSSDRAPDKVARKRGFIASLLAVLDRLPDETRTWLVIGGDYNVITRDHQPPYRGFLPFEYQMLDALDCLGLVDAHQQCSPGVQAHSWIGRSGNGYRFDYFHVGAALTERVVACSYLHEPREQKLADHAAVGLTLDLPAVVRLPGDPGGLADVGTLF